MQKQAGIYTPLIYSLLGGLAGGITAHNRGGMSPAVGAGAGALLGSGLGAAVNALTYERPKKHDRLEPGFYYGARNIYADNRLVQDIPVVGPGFRHSFLFSVYDNKPKNIPSVKLPNGQYVTTFSAGKLPNPRGKKQESPELYVSILDKPNVASDKFKPANDIVTLRQYLDPDSVDNWEGNLRTIMLAKGDKKATDLARRAAAIIAKWDNKRLGDYRALSSGEDYGNCNTVAASLIDSLDIPEEDRPWRVGGIGGVSRSAMHRYRNLMTRALANELDE